MLQAPTYCVPATCFSYPGKSPPKTMELGFEDDCQSQGYAQRLADAVRGFAGLLKTLARAPKVRHPGWRPLPRVPIRR